MAAATVAAAMRDDGGDARGDYAMICNAMHVCIREAYLRQPRGERALVLCIGPPTEGGHEGGRPAAAMLQARPLLEFSFGICMVPPLLLRPGGGGVLGLFTPELRNSGYPKMFFFYRNLL